MNKRDCIQRLKAYVPIPPSEAITWAREHWEDIKHILLNEMDEHRLQNFYDDLAHFYACFGDVEKRIHVNTRKGIIFIKLLDIIPEEVYI